jgi:hypothetical protein
MNDNVIILGAGASVDAGIPVLSNFVQVMWETAIRKTVYKEPLSETDCEIFRNAIKVRDELDHYHGRANFDDRNIEDILSILTFNLYEGKSNDRKRLNWIIKAIERTIELYCKVKYDEKKNMIQEFGNHTYIEFWDALLNHDDQDIPTIISFNYDLVLERALLQLLNNTAYKANQRYSNNVISFDYYFKNIESIKYLIKHQDYSLARSFNLTSGTRAEYFETERKDIQVKLLKLHGSINFTLENSKQKRATQAAEKSYILPPVFSKNNSRTIQPVWKEALISLRKAKNIVFIGYSLPQTDIYMQYFLKSSFGPNNSLNKIFVFDPALYKDSIDSRNMIDRYKACFSPQIHDRIDFTPYSDTDSFPEKGTFKHFVYELNNNPDYMIF